MADKRIVDFVTLEDAQDDDLILVASEDTTYNMKVKTIKDAVEGNAQRAEAAALEAQGKIENALVIAADLQVKGEAAQEAAENAKAKAQAAQEATAAADTATQKANTASAAANMAAEAAHTAKTNADTATEAAVIATAKAEKSAEDADIANKAATAAAENAILEARAAQAAAERASDATSLANTAAAEATAAKDMADAAAEIASTAADNADTARKGVKAAIDTAGTAAKAADTAAGAANTAKEAANTAAAAAETATQNAQTQADYAKGQGDRAKALVDTLEDTNIGGLAADILELQSGKASINSPVLTGTPKAPTPVASSNDTTIATTAFVTAAVDKAMNGLFRLDITFGAGRENQSFSVTGGSFTYTGTVPSTMKAVVAVPDPNMTYTVTCGASSVTVTTTSYFGSYPVYVYPTLANSSWEEIAIAAASGKAASYWEIGDEKDITLGTGEVLTFQIYGFDHDDLTSGGKAPITFGMKNLMTQIRQMESSSTNAGSFTGSAMYEWLQNTLFLTLPEDLQGLIKSVDKKTSAGQKSATIKTESMKIFLLSAIENGLRTTDYIYENEGETYPIFTNSVSRIKCLANGAGSAYTWWERSPIVVNSSSFCLVLSGGVSGNNIATFSSGVCFGFCI